MSRVIPCCDANRHGSDPPELQESAGSEGDEHHFGVQIPFPITNVVGFRLDLSRDGHKATRFKLYKSEYSEDDTPAVFESRRAMDEPVTRTVPLDGGGTFTVRCVFEEFAPITRSVLLSAADAEYILDPDAGGTCPAPTSPLLPLFLNRVANVKQCDFFFCVN